MKKISFLLGMLTLSLFAISPSHAASSNTTDSDFTLESEADSSAEESDDLIIEVISDTCLHERTDEFINPATFDEDGRIYEQCLDCGEILDEEVIYAVDAVVIDPDVCDYDGTDWEPDVMIYDRDDNELIYDEDYYVEYENNRKVGTASVNIILTGDYYYGDCLYDFKIVPPSTEITDLTAAANGFKVEWEACSVQTSGFQIQYSTKKDFSTKKTITVSGKSKTDYTVKNLKYGKKYYVRVRSYKTVDDKKYYSSWSSKEKVATKTKDEALTEAVVDNFYTYAKTMDVSSMRDLLNVSNKSSYFKLPSNLTKLAKKYNKKNKWTIKSVTVTDNTAKVKVKVKYTSLYEPFYNAMNDIVWAYVFGYIDQSQVTVENVVEVAKDYISSDTVVSTSKTVTFNLVKVSGKWKIKKLTDSIYDTILMDYMKANNDL